jgi:hypothetical protein
MPFINFILTVALQLINFLLCCNFLSLRIIRNIISFILFLQPEILSLLCHGYSEERILNMVHGIQNRGAGYKTGFIRHRTGFTGYKTGFTRYRTGFTGYKTGFTRYRTGFTGYKTGFTRYRTGFTKQGSRYRTGFTRYKTGLKDIEQDSRDIEEDSYRAHGM